MSTLIIHPETEAQEKAVKAVLEALQIEFEHEMDETERINSNSYLKDKIEKGLEDIRNGNTQKLDLNDLWK